MLLMSITRPYFIIVDDVSFFSKLVGGMAKNNLRKDSDDKTEL